MPCPGRVVVATVLCCLLACGASATTIHVATDGSDANDGSAQAPFATLHRARDAVRALKPLTEPVTVEIAGGTYYLQEPLLLTPEDSGTAQFPITWRARPGDTALLSGGRSIEGPWQTDDGKIYYANLPNVGDGDWFFRQLRVGGERAQRARHPNAASDYPWDGPWLYAAPRGFSTSLGINMAQGLGALQQQGTWLEYEIEVPADDEYFVRVLYANSGDTNERFSGVTDMSARTSISVDGGAPIPVRDLTDTGSFYSGFRWANAGRMTLTAGEHTFRWENTEGGALSLLGFVLTTDPHPQLPLPGDVSGTEVEGPTVAFSAVDYDRKYPHHRHLVIVHNMLDRKDRRLHTSFGFYPGDMQQWQHMADAEVYVIPEYDWVSELVRLTSVDEDTGIAHIEGANATKPIFPRNRYCVLNVLDVLDTPGEWCLVSDEGRVYYYPEDPNFPEEEIVAPHLERVIELRGDPEGDGRVSHIRFEGLTFTDTRYTSPERMTDTYHVNDGAIWMVDARDCRISDCTFRDVGGYGVWLHADSTDNVIVSSEFVGCGQGGVYMDGYVRNSFREAMADGRRPQHNLVAGNHIHHCGLFYAHVSGVYSAVSGENLIAHNRIHQMPRYGVSLKGDCPDAVIEYNDVQFTNLLTRDTGAIEMAGNHAGSIVRYNLVRDSIGSGYDAAAGRHTSPNDSCGIYLDNTSSRNTVLGNVVARCTRGLHLNYGGGNVIEGNIFYNASGEQLLLNLSRDENQDRDRNLVRENVVVCSAPGATCYIVRNWEGALEKVICERNLVWAGGETPVIDGIGGSPEQAWHKWLDAGQEAGTLVEDPLLTDTERDEFRLQADSPAFNLGFEPIDYTRMGPAGYSDELIERFLEREQQ